MALVMEVSRSPYCQKDRDYSNATASSCRNDAQNDRERQEEMLEYSGAIWSCSVCRNGEYVQWAGAIRGAAARFSLTPAVCHE